MSVSLFVGNLSPRTSERELARFCSAAGSVVAVRIPLDRETGRPRGFGFVEFATEEEAERALSALGGRELDGRRLRLGRARDREEREERRLGRAGEGGLRNPQGGAAWRDNGEDWGRSDDGDLEDYTRERGSRQRRGSRHGSDRTRGRGNRRVIE